MSKAIAITSTLILIFTLAYSNLTIKDLTNQRNYLIKELRQSNEITLKRSMYLAECLNYTP